MQRPVHYYGFAEPDTSLFAAQAVDSPLANMCDTHDTCVAKIRKEWPPARETPSGIHTRLYETAEAFRT
ncbi:hypothetical protein ACWEKM_18480 [Streptomyces sp. NPDC004752]